MEERSAGAVVFNDKRGRRYLLLLNKERWDFPKGNMEAGENELDTVLREVREETGLRHIDIVPGFRRKIEYFYRRDGQNVHKQVVYLLARTKEEKITISSEHQSSGWFPYSGALAKVSYNNSKATLKEAELFLKGAAVPAG
ncbi:MAG: NUDIX domain-containing protein [Nitrososphaerales archaeon]|nr:NUDIX domain-containing protein [Nitrososphaerales archaeon]